MISSYDCSDIRRTKPYHTKSDDATSTIWHDPLDELIIRVRLQTWIKHPANRRVSFQPFRESKRRFAVALSAQSERFQPLQEQPRIEWAHARTQVTHRVHPQLSSEGLGAVRVPEAQTVIPVRRLSEGWEFSVIPFKGSVNDYAAHTFFFFFFFFFEVRTVS